jgi:glycosyltransferase involved in cell wall biosynthesis
MGCGGPWRLCSRSPRSRLTADAPAGGRGAEVPLVRVIARLNIGGPSIQAITLTDRLRSRGYETTLVRGVEGPREGNMDDLARELAVKPLRIDTMRREPGPQDLRALGAMTRILKRKQPKIVHTHAAKAGTIGRLAAVMAAAGRPGQRPVVIHTYHGHSLTGYFSPRTAAVYRRIEQGLARHSDRLIAVSDEVRDELVDLGVAGREHFEVIPLGFDLTRFDVPEAERARLRRCARETLGIPPTARVLTLIGRLVPIKRIDRFLRAARALSDLDDVRFLIIGDGELRDELHRSEATRELDGRLIWAGFRRDIPALCFASDVVVLTSDNEGTPVSLIEAAAARVPVVSTDVGGAATVVRDGETGFLVPAENEATLAERLRLLLDDEALRRRMGAAGRQRATSRFELERLVADHDQLYRDLLRR